MGEEGATVTNESSQQEQAAAGDHLMGDQQGQQQENKGGDTLATGQDPDQKKTEPGKEGEGEDGGEGDQAATYEAFQMPEMGEGQEVDQGLIDAVSPFMQKHGLDQAAAQELVSAGAEYILSQQKAQAEAYAATVDQWAKDAKADPDFGGVGGKDFNQNASYAQSFLAKYGSPELTALLGKGGYGLGNHPAVLKAFAKAGRDISSDGTLAGAGGSGNKTDDADLLYGNSQT